MSYHVDAAGRSWELPDVTTVVKYLLASAVGTAAWAAVVSWGLGSEPAGREVELLVIAWVMVLPAAFLEVHLPTEIDDNYHRLGASAAVFFSINIALSTVVVVRLVWAGDFNTHQPLFGQVVAAWILASIFLPGPVVGAAIARRWSR